MVTEQELREVLTGAADDAAAETYMLGLSDRALAMAEGRGTRRWARYAPGVAVGTAFAVAGTFGVLALDGGSGGGGGGGERVASLNAPTMATNPAAQSALVDFEVECLDKGAPKMAMDWVWDPETQQYHGVDGDVYTAFTPSPDGKRALVVQGMPAVRWAVAGWSDAVAGRLTFHDLGALSGGVRWTTDGAEVTNGADWITGADATGKPVVMDDSVEFYDPSTGAARSVHLPAAVIDRITSGQWVLQQWQGDHDSVVFPMASVSGDRVEWLDTGGKVVRTVTVQNGLAATAPKGIPFLQTATSPDGRFLTEFNATVVATFDLRAGGRRIAQSSPDVQRSYYLGWTGDHEITLAIDETGQDAGKPGSGVPKTRHDLVYRVLGPDLKVIEETKFPLPEDPQGHCASWPVTWAPKTQFPGAFVP
ncbi:hypothetical protein [Catenulispora subtropica]|uniref:Uncharacterized protein n=1 Tax=Catenulispora subtropica TaxID=450798 RepID=A0ABN2S639_9ACTN